MLGRRNPGNEAKVLNSDRSSHKRSQNQWDYCVTQCQTLSSARLALGEAYVAKSARNTMLNTKRQGAAKPSLVELTWLEHDSHLARLVRFVVH